MKQPRYNKDEIIGILQAAEAAGNIRSICANRHISEQTFYRWRKKYGTQNPTAAPELSDLDDGLELKSKLPDLSSKGMLRREALIQATLRIIARDGPGSATLRAVEAEAQATHGSVVYYFGNCEDLIHQSLTVIAHRNIKALAQAWHDIEPHAEDPKLVAKLIAQHSVSQMISDHDMGITIIELHLAAARHPEYRPALREWGRAYVQIVRNTLTALGTLNPKADAALFTNMISGLIIAQLALPRPDFETRILKPAILRLLLASTCKIE